MLLPWARAQTLRAPVAEGFECLRTHPPLAPLRSLAPVPLDLTVAESSAERRERQVVQPCRFPQRQVSGHESLGTRRAVRRICMSLVSCDARLRLPVGQTNGPQMIRSLYDWSRIVLPPRAAHPEGRQRLPQAAVRAGHPGERPLRRPDRHPGPRRRAAPRRCCRWLVSIAINPAAVAPPAPPSPRSRRNDQPRDTVSTSTTG